MKVSVVVAFYNVEQYVEECIDSLVRQSYKDLEIILVDDGSTDGTGDIIDKFASLDDRIKVIHEDNQGLSFARNSGMQLATGEAIAFVDGDDAVKEAYFETLVSNMNATGADLSAVGRYENVLGEDTFKYLSAVDNLTVYDDYREYIYDTYTDKDKRFLMSGIVVWGKLFRREIWEGIEFPEGRINEDSWVFTKVVSRCRKIVIAPDNLYFYRKRPGSIMSVENEYVMRSDIESWLSQVKWWRESMDPLKEKLLCACERLVCHKIFLRAGRVNVEFKKIIEEEYRAMTKHLIRSRYISLKTKIRYWTIASPRRVFR